MRLSRRFAPVFLALALVTALPSDAMPHARVKVRAEPRKPADPQPFGADCRTSVSGSHAVAYCHNPYVDIDRVRLHIECDRWWDLDTDSAPVATGPAMTVRLDGRCWDGIRTVWVSHER